MELLVILGMVVAFGCGCAMCQLTARERRERWAKEASA